MSIASTRTTVRPKVVIIGGGATGTGIARVIAEQGMEVVLIERGEFGSGTSGRFHGMLHSGARYAVADPEVARECYEENQRLRLYVPGVITDTGGLFVALNDEEAAHADAVLAACQAAGIPTKELSAADARHREPNLAPTVTRAFTVPDGFIDGGKLLAANIAAAQAAKGQVTLLRNHIVTSFYSHAGRIASVTVQDAKTNAIESIACDYVINAGGVWAGKIADLAGANIEMLFDKGTMIIFDGHMSSAVLNRCRPEADGDLLVPHGGQSIMGTTARVVTDPDEGLPTQEEADLLVREGSLLVPMLATAEAVKIYAGVRPLYGAGALKKGDSRAMSRSYQVIDHTSEGIENFMSVVGGKVTLYQRMAESALTLLQQKIG